MKAAEEASPLGSLLFVLRVFLCIGSDSRFRDLPFACLRVARDAKWTNIIALPFWNFVDGQIMLACPSGILLLVKLCSRAPFEFQIAYAQLQLYS